MIGGPCVRRRREKRKAQRTGRRQGRRQAERQTQRQACRQAGKRRDGRTAERQGREGCERWRATRATEQREAQSRAEKTCAAQRGALPCARTQSKRTLYLQISASVLMPTCGGVCQGVWMWARTHRKAVVAALNAPPFPIVITTNTSPSARAWRKALAWPKCIRSKQPSSHTRTGRPSRPAAQKSIGNKASERGRPLESLRLTSAHTHTRTHPPALSSLAPSFLQIPASLLFSMRSSRRWSCFSLSPKSL